MTLLRTVATGVFAAVAMVALVDPAPCAAQTDEARARQHYDAALSYFDQSSYEDAAREFRQAYRLSGRAHLLLNVATCFENLDRPSEAADTLREYIAADPAASDRRTVEVRIQQLDAQAAERASLAQSQVVQPPDGEPGEDPAENRGLLVPGVITASTGAALAIAAIGTGVAAHGLFTDLEAQCPGDVCPAALMDDRDQGDALALASTVLTFGAVAAGIAGLVLMLLD